MFITSLGKRVLVGNEGKLFREAAAYLSDVIWEMDGEDDCLVETGIELFDSLTKKQKLSMLCIAVMSLLNKEIEPPRRAAIVDATIAAIYEYLMTTLRIEEEDRVEPYFTNLVGSAYSEILGRASKPKCLFTYRVHATKADKLDVMVGVLVGSILEDEDFALYELMVDKPPEVAAAYKKRLGVEDDYFTVVAPEVGDDLTLHLTVLKQCEVER